jgi:putative ABC transport system permease protein
MNSITQDLRYALRTLRARPGFALVALLTLGLGIGATTAIFTLLDAIVLRPLPYPNAERLVAVRHTAPGLGIEDAGVSDGTYRHYRGANRVFDDLGAYQEIVLNITGVDAPERVHVAVVTPSVFTVLDAVPAHGRLFTEAETREQSPVVVISHGLWRRRFNADPEIVGRTIRLHEAPYTVVGVMPAGFEFPRRETDVWRPYGSILVHTPTVFGLYSDAIARLRPGISPREAEGDLQRLVAQLPELFSDVTTERLREAQFRAVVVPLKRAVIGNMASALWVLLGGVAFFLVIACANVANLFLIRAEHRRRELAVRLALGASGSDVGRTFVVEALLLTAAGALLGLALADAGVSVLAALEVDLPRLHEVALDWRALGFAIGVSLVSALVLPLAPYLRYRRIDLASTLAATRPAGERPERQGLHRGLVSLQIALALMLLVGSALMVRSFWRLSRVDPGFDPSGVLTVELALPYSSYPSSQAAAAFYDRLIERIRALPGVIDAGGATPLPLTPIPSYYRMSVIAGSVTTDSAASAAAPVLISVATLAYFTAMRIPLAEGRLFAAGDAANRDHEIVVNRAFARRYFPGRDALGQLVRFRRRGTIVGVVEDVHQESIGSAPGPTLYVPVLPGDRAARVPYIPFHMGIAIRTAVSPLTLAEPVRRIVQELDRNLPVGNIRTMEDIVATSTARTTFATLLLLIAAVGALFLGSVGVYGVMAYTVSRRTHEMGVRIALGARASQVTAMVLRQAAGVAAVGLVAGTLGALALTRVLRGLLFEITPTDPLSFAATACVLLAATLIASWIPARRATQVDPMVALRTE